MPLKDFLSKNLPVKRDQEVNPFWGLQRDMNRLFENFFDEFRISPFSERGLSTFPKVNIKETDKQIKISAELPGLEAKDIDISISDNVLTLRGQKSEESESKDENYYLVERSFGSFNRTINLPAEVDSDKVRAEFKNGVLDIVLTKKPDSQQKTKKIEIKTN